MPRISAKKAKPESTTESKPIEESIEATPVAESSSVAATDPPESAPETPPEPIPQPKKAKTPPPLVSDLVADELQREQRLAEAREELVFRRYELLKIGQDLSASEYRLLQTAIGKTPHLSDFECKQAFQQYLNKERLRVSKVLDLQGKAGSPSDREASDKQAEATARKRDAEAPGIEERICELQKQLQALRSEADAAQQAADARHQAVKSLCDEKLLPPFVLDEIASCRRENENEFAGELRNLEARKTQIVGTLEIDHNSPTGLAVIRNHVSGSRRFGVDELSRLGAMFEVSIEQRPGGIAHRFGKLRFDRWDAYLDSLREELVAVEARIEAIKEGEQADADRNIEEMRSYYVPK